MTRRVDLELMPTGRADEGRQIHGPVSVGRQVDFALKNRLMIERARDDEAVRVLRAEIAEFDRQRGTRSARAGHADHGDIRRFGKANLADLGKRPVREGTASMPVQLLFCRSLTMTSSAFGGAVSRRAEPRASRRRGGRARSSLSGWRARDVRSIPGPRAR